MHSVKVIILEAITVFTMGFRQLFRFFVQSSGEKSYVRYLGDVLSTLFRYLCI